MRASAAYLLIRLTGADGSELDLNPDEVVTLRVSTEDRDTFHGAVNCVIRTVDGAAFGVKETCETIRNNIIQLFKD